VDTWQNEVVKPAAAAVKATVEVAHSSRDLFASIVAASAILETATDAAAKTADAADRLTDRSKSSNAAAAAAITSSSALRKMQDTVALLMQTASEFESAAEQAKNKATAAADATYLQPT
jgi:hypothetical protein